MQDKYLKKFYKMNNDNKIFSLEKAKSDAIRDSFKDKIYNKKIVSVWGIGYLGYTTILTLQNSGFCTTLHDFNSSRLDGLINGIYPNAEQLNSWTKNGKIPLVELKYIEVEKNPNLLFDNDIHIVSFPHGGSSDYKLLAEIFIDNRDNLHDCLVIFQSAGAPKDIEINFIDVLKKNDIIIDVVTVFRSDWVIEDFLNKKNQRIISTNTYSSRYKLELFLSLLSLDIVELSNIENAEVYENTKQSLNYTIVAFFNQLSLAYPHIDINTIAKNLINDISSSHFSLGVNSVDFKSEKSINNLLSGASGDKLSILKEANRTNLSFLFFYIDILKSKNINSITILGLSSSDNLKDLRFSPSIILAEYLHQEHIPVYIHDDNISKKELVNVLPQAKFADIYSCPIKSDVVFIMSLSSKYKYFTQNTVSEIGLIDVRYILDNTGYFKGYQYSPSTHYHHLCDGKLIDILE